MFPGCTIRNTPSEPIHCIVWAKHLFRYRQSTLDFCIGPDYCISPLPLLALSSPPLPSLSPPSSLSLLPLSSPSPLPLLAPSSPFSTSPLPLLALSSLSPLPLSSLSSPSPRPLLVEPDADNDVSPKTEEEEGVLSPQPSPPSSSPSKCVPPYRYGDMSKSIHKTVGGEQWIRSSDDIP